MIKIVKREAIFIPGAQLKKSQIDSITKKLTFHFYGKEKICDDCEWRAEREDGPCDICNNCANYNGTTILASRVVVGENRYLKIPVGSSPAVLGGLKDVELLDKSPKTKIAPIKFTGTLRTEQEEAVAALIQKKRGVLEAPPRSGKTVMLTAMACRLGLKTLILATQRDWLMGFKETFVGSETQIPLTNLKPTRIKICKTLKDFQDTDICLATVQSFYSEGGEKLLAKIRDFFPVILVDEIQTGAAAKFAQILTRLNSDYLISCSGTPDRKDGRYVLVENIVGPILHIMETKRLRPHVRVTRTGYTKSYKGQIPWPRMVSGLENDKKRLQCIAKRAVLDVADGHMVLIPTAQVKPIAKLVDLINAEAGKRIAWPFTGGLTKKQRDLYIQKAREGRIKVLVGTQKILSVGINIPRASCLYETVLSSNIPNATQRIARVLTPLPDKRAMVRYFLDDMNVRRNCLRNEWFNCMVPVFKPIVSQNVNDMLMAYFKNGTRHEKFDL